MSSIKENVQSIQEKMFNACLRAGRNPESVKLMAVSKFHPQEAVFEAIEAGLDLFGENRVQEAAEKFPAVLEQNPDVSLHLIGSLQKNKVKHIVPLASCIQSVDRFDLAEEIVRQCGKVQRTTPLKLLFEVHTGEDSKAGFTDLDELLRTVEFCEANAGCGIVPAGFMTMAPFTDEEEAIRASFRKLVKIRNQVQTRFSALKLDELSMGMSADFEIAIEEGSSLIRVGTAIFGERVYA